MKTLKTISKFLVLTACAVMLSCSSDDDGGGGGSTPSGTYVKAKVDGTMFETYRIQGVSVATAISTGSGTGRLIMIAGSTDMNGTNSWSINLMGINSTGEYTINSDSDSSLAFVETGGSGNSYDTSNCPGATGTVNITHIDSEKVEGTFSFVGKVDENCSMSKNITEGSFRGVFMQTN